MQRIEGSRQNSAPLTAWRDDQYTLERTIRSIKDCILSPICPHPSPSITFSGAGVKAKRLCNERTDMKN